MNVHSSTDDYALKRDHGASTRLTAQHFLWKSALGYLLHPSIPVPPQARIADVATGNGCWLLDVGSSTNDQLTLDGFDISLDQVPDAQLTSASALNIHFHTWDILQKPPAEFVGVFDVVHIRLITVIFHNDDPIPIIESLRALLKPGGFLQWEEVDNTACNVIEHGNDEAPALRRVLNHLAGSGRGDWKHGAAEVLNHNGFSNAQQIHVEHSRLYARYWNDMYMSTWAEYANKTMDHGEAAKLKEAAMVEVRRGSAINCPMWIWVAQRS